MALTEAEQAEYEALKKQLATAPQSAGQGPSEIESGIRGAAQMGTLGFADELQSYWEEPPLVGDPEKRKKILAGIREEYKRAQEVNPKSYMAGQVVGGVGSSFIPGIGVGKNVGLLSGIARGALSGGALAVGESEKDLSEIAKSEDEQKEILKRMVLGGGTAGAAGLISKGLGKASDVLTAKATGATFGEARHFKPGTIKAIKENKLIPVWGTAEDVAQRAKDKLDEVGSGIGNKLTTLNKSGVTVTREEIEKQLAREARSLNRIGDIGAKKQLQARTEDILDSMGTNKSVPTTWIQKQKVSIAPDSPAWLNPDVAKGDKKMYSGLAKLIAKKAKGFGIGDELRAEQKLYGELAPVFKAAANKALKNQQMVAAGLMDLAVGGAVGGGEFMQGVSNLDVGQALKGAGKGIAAAATRHYVGPRAAGALARSAGGLANLQAPEILSRPAANTVFSMLKKIDEKKKR